MSNAGSTNGAVITILQITDCHLTKDADGELLGVKTQESLDAVLDKIEELGEQPDYILATGDLAQDASPEAYALFKERMSRFDCPVSWFPGNHDQRDAMYSVVGDGDEMRKVMQIGNWQFVLLDSLVEGSVFGSLSGGELDVLQNALEAEPDLNTMVCLHHHPVDIESTWLDNIGLHNRDAFWQIVDGHSQVKSVLWGHIHQEYDEMRGNVRLLASPSTCIQFLPKSNDFAVDDIAPGYRRLRLHPDGSMETEVIRADAYEFELDMQSNGY